MLNRRVLRIKAMQALYSYFLTKESIKEMVCDELVEKYALDPAIHDFADRDIIEAKQKIIRETFYALYDSESAKIPEGIEAEELDDIKESLGRYHTQIGNELVAIKKNMMAETDSIFHSYLKILMLPAELAFIDKQEEDKAEKAYIKKERKWHFNLAKNPFIQALESFKPLLDLSIDNKISWQGETDLVKGWYRDVLKVDESMIAYQAIENPTDEEHVEAVQQLMKKLVFKHDAIESYLSEMDLRWSENKPIIKSLVLKTLKSYEPDLDEKFELKSLSYNQEEDYGYFEELFKETVRRNDDLDEIIANKAKNWDLDRIATLDIIILKMALTEMIVFSSVPVKVTINEFIEISKNYSTPKSKQFVNGILDVLANELTSEGVIKKSGRGLIDNK